LRQVNPNERPQWELCRINLSNKKSIMKKNIGAADGIVRLLISIVSICYAIIWGPWWLALIAVALIPTVYAIWCPIWEVLGINTNKGESQHS
jgi:hypothetical protein